jgi:hypothetical protein
VHGNLLFCAPGGERRAQLRVGGDPAGERERADALFAVDGPDPVEQGGDDRVLEGRQQVDEIRIEAVGVERRAIHPALLELAQHRGLEPREGEVPRAVAGASDRERMPVRAAARGNAVHDGPARVAEPCAARDLVERLAGRVVARAGQWNDHAVLDADELRVASRDDEAVKRKSDGQGSRAARLQVRREKMPLEMVDADERDPTREGQSLACREAHEQRADQPGPGRRGDEPDVLEADARPSQRFFENRGQIFEVRARRHFRNDAAVRRVRPHLRGDDVGQHAALAVEHGDRRLVAGGLDPEDDHDDGSRLSRSAARRLAENGGRHTPRSVTIAVM